MAPRVRSFEERSLANLKSRFIILGFWLLSVPLRYSYKPFERKQITVSPNIGPISWIYH